MVYDRTRQRVIVFGGRTGGASRDDTWALDLATVAWTQLASAPAARPPDRFSVVAGVDAARDRLLITTGEDDAGTFFDDVWALDLATDSWSQVAPAGGPPARRYGSAGGIFDVEGTGGPALYLSHGFTFSGRFDDAWELDLATDSWRQLPAAAPLPLKRCLHTATMIDAQRMLIFGGCASGFGPCPLDDLWQLDAALPGWTELAITGPSARTHPALASIGASGHALMFGGQASGNQNDLWLVDAGTPSWRQLTPASAPPPARNGHNAIWIDSPAGDACGRLLVFGGAGSGGELADLWSFAPPRSSGPAPVIHAIRTTGGVELRWASAPGIAWEAWRDTRPDFEPGDAGAVLLTSPITIAAGTATTRDDPVPSPTTDYFWEVRAAGCP